MKFRYTTENLPPPNHRHTRHRILIEQSYDDRSFFPVDFAESYVDQEARHFFGWAPRGEGDWASHRLKYLRRIDVGLWECEIYHPCID